MFLTVERRKTGNISGNTRVGLRTGHFWSGLARLILTNQSDSVRTKNSRDYQPTNDNSKWRSQFTLAVQLLIEIFETFRMVGIHQK